MRSFISNVVLNPLVLWVMGFVVGIIGIGLAIDIPVSLGRVQRAKNLQPLHATAPGQSAFIDGYISEETPTIYRDFVAYLREQRRTCYETSCWAEIARESPPLLIQLQEGVARISNDDYAFDSTAITIEEAEPTVFKGAVQARGFVVGSPVFAVGQVSADGDTRALDAEFIYAGSRQQYIADLLRYTTRALPWSAGCIIVAVVFGVVGWVQMRRFLREIKEESASPAS